MTRQQTALRISLLLGAIAVFGWFAATRISFDTDPLELLPADLPEATGLKLFQNRFGKDIDLMVVIEGKDPEQVQEAARSLTEHLLSKPGLVGDAYWRPPSSESGDPAIQADFDPLNFAELIAYGWMNAPPEAWEKLHAQLTPESSNDALEEAFETVAYGQFIDPEASLRASTDPLGIVYSLPEFRELLNSGGEKDQFSAQDGKVRLVRAEAPNDIANYKRTIAWLEVIEPEIRAWQSSEPSAKGLAIDWTGRAPYTAEIASAMEREMKWSVAIAILLIHTLFFIFYRRFIPIIWLVLCLALTFTITLTIGSFLFDDLGATSVGFAAILIGLAVDYGFVIYQESLKHGTEPRALRKKLIYSIGWASVTTAAVFLGLRLSSLPGAAQLGTMVGIGITVGAIVMLTIFTWLNHLSPPKIPAVKEVASPDTRRRSRFEFAATGGLIIAAISVLLLGGLPAISASADDLKPKESHASDVFVDIWTKFGWASDGGIRVIVSGKDEAEVGERIRQVREILAADLASNPMPREVQLPPTALLRNPTNQNANHQNVTRALEAFARIKEDSLKVTRPDNLEPEHVEDMLALSNAISSAWEKFANLPPETPLMATEPASRWVLDSVVSREKQPVCAIGNIRLPKRSEATDAEELRLAALLTRDTEGIYPAGWYLLRPAIVRIINHELYWVVLPMAAVLLVMLWLAFRRLRRVALSISALLFSGLALLAIMSLLGEKWNLMNLAGIPLLLGAGLDYSIHMQLALRRLNGDTAEARRTIGRALVLCGLSTATGFGTLIWSTNAGLASLGLVCSIGIVVTMLTCVFLLPAWYRWTHKS